MIDGTAPTEQVTLQCERGGCQRGRFASPGHGRNECRRGIEAAAEVVDTLGVVGEEFRTEIGMAQSDLAQHIELARHHRQCPLALSRVEEVDAQSRCHNTPMTLFFPVDGERIEIVALKIHHGKESIHQVVAHPCLCILADGGAGVPTTGAVSAQVVILADRRARQFDPWFLAFDSHSYLPHDIGDISDTFGTALALAQLRPCLRVAYIVEVDAVDIVPADNLATHRGQIVARLRLLRIHVTLVADTLHQSGVLLP